MLKPERYDDRYVVFWKTEDGIKSRNAAYSLKSFDAVRKEFEGLNVVAVYHGDPKKLY